MVTDRIEETFSLFSPLADLRGVTFPFEISFLGVENKHVHMNELDTFSNFFGTCKVL